MLSSSRAAPTRCRARQLRASDRPAGAGWSGSERRRFGLAARFRLNHASQDWFPKLRVVGSSPIARSRRIKPKPAPAAGFVLLGLRCVLPLSIAENRSAKGAGSSATGAEHAPDPSQAVPELRESLRRSPSGQSAHSSFESFAHANPSLRRNAKPTFIDARITTAPTTEGSTGVSIVTGVPLTATHASPQSAAK